MRCSDCGPQWRLRIWSPTVVDKSAEQGACLSYSVSMRLALQSLLSSGVDPSCVGQDAGGELRLRRRGDKGVNVALGLSVLGVWELALDRGQLSGELVFGDRVHTGVCVDAAVGVLLPEPDLRELDSHAESVVR